MNVAFEGRYGLQVLIFQIITLYKYHLFNNWSRMLKIQICNHGLQSRKEKCLVNPFKIRCVCMHACMVHDFEFLLSNN